jgi:hypothetical protein
MAISVAPKAMSSSTIKGQEEASRLLAFSTDLKKGASSNSTRLNTLVILAGVGVFIVPLSPEQIAQMNRR